MYNKKYIDFKNTVTMLQMLHPYSDKALRCNSWFFILLHCYKLKPTYQHYLTTI